MGSPHGHPKAAGLAVGLVPPQCGVGLSVYEVVWGQGWACRAWQGGAVGGQLGCQPLLPAPRSRVGNPVGRGLRPTRTIPNPGTILSACFPRSSPASQTFVVRSGVHMARRPLKRTAAPAHPCTCLPTQPAAGQPPTAGRAGSGPPPPKTSPLNKNIRSVPPACARAWPPTLLSSPACCHLTPLHTPALPRPAPHLPCSWAFTQPFSHQFHGYYTAITLKLHGLKQEDGGHNPPASSFVLKGTSLHLV
jgi:hypothetical protein